MSDGASKIVANIFGNIFYFFELMQNFLYFEEIRDFLGDVMDVLQSIRANIQT